jgi:hypothetical protein
MRFGDPPQNPVEEAEFGPIANWKGGAVAAGHAHAFTNLHDDLFGGRNPRDQDANMTAIRGVTALGWGPLAPLQQ